MELIAPLMDGRVKVIIRESFIDFPDYVPPTNLSRFNWFPSPAWSPGWPNSFQLSLLAFSLRRRTGRQGIWRRPSIRHNFISPIIAGTSVLDDLFRSPPMLNLFWIWRGKSFWWSGQVDLPMEKKLNIAHTVKKPVSNRACEVLHYVSLLLILQREIK